MKTPKFKHVIKFNVNNKDCVGYFENGVFKEFSNNNNIYHETSNVSSWEYIVFNKQLKFIEWIIRILTFLSYLITPTLIFMLILGNNKYIILSGLSFGIISYIIDLKFNLIKF